MIFWYAKVDFSKREEVNIASTTDASKRVRGKHSINTDAISLPTRRTEDFCTVNCIMYRHINMIYICHNNYNAAFVRV